MFDQAVTPLAPLADAAVGEWARYRTAQGWVQQLRVVAVEPAAGGQVTIEVQVLADGSGGGALGLPARRRQPKDLDWALAEAERRGARVVQRGERIGAAGRQWDTRLTVARWTAEGEHYEQRIWMSPLVPVWGLVRMELREFRAGRAVASLELMDFGNE